MNFRCSDRRRARRNAACTVACEQRPSSPFDNSRCSHEREASRVFRRSDHRVRCRIVTSGRAQNSLDSPVHALVRGRCRIELFAAERRESIEADLVTGLRFTACDGGPTIREDTSECRIQCPFVNAQDASRQGLNPPSDRRSVQRTGLKHTQDQQHECALRLRVQDE